MCHTKYEVDEKYPNRKKRGCGNLSERDLKIGQR